MHCATCFWYSSGFQDPRGSGYCYSEGDYVQEDGTCPFYEPRKRLNPETGEMREDEE